MITINASHDSALEFYSEKINKLFDDIIYCKHIKRGNPIQKFFLSDVFLNFLSEKRNVLIFGYPKNLLIVNQEYEDLVLTEHEREDIKSFFKQTGYENFQKNYSKEFLDLLGMDTCVYCNRNYTINLVNTHARAELDHWFPKDKFPILAISFYNLIPSCHSCNHIKGNSKDINWWRNNSLNEIIHPYFKDIKEVFKFSYSYTKSLDKFKIKLNVLNNSKMHKTLEFNKTKEIYEAHSEIELRDLVSLANKYPDKYLDQLFEDFSKLKMSKEEIYRNVFGIETKEKDYHKRPFSKFKHDIIEELKSK